MEDTLISYRIGCKEKTLFLVKINLRNIAYKTMIHSKPKQ